MATLFGSFLRDRLIGSAAADTIFGDSGNDVIKGQNGADEVIAGLGDDRVFGGGGNDLLMADFDERTFFFSPATGKDWVSGGAGNDRIVTGGGNDTLRGDAGNDTLQGGAGRDVVNGGSGNDLLFWDERDASIDGGSGVDRLRIASADLDLRALPDNRIRNIEILDMTGGNGIPDRLTLGKAELVDVSSASSTLRVLGDFGDVLDILGRATDLGVDGRFHVYRMGAAVLLVDTDVTVI